MVTPIKQSPGNLYTGVERRKKIRCPACGSSLYEEYLEQYSGSTEWTVEGDCKGCGNVTKRQHTEKERLDFNGNG